MWGRHGGADPPRYQGLFLCSGKIGAHALTDTFPVLKTKHGHIRELRVTQRKCSDGKHYISPLQLWRTDKLLLRCSLGSLENLHFQNIFAGHTRYERFQACAGQRAESHNRVFRNKSYQTRCNNNRVACMKSICEYALARGKDLRFP